MTNTTLPAALAAAVVAIADGDRSDLARDCMAMGRELYAPDDLPPLATTVIRWARYDRVFAPQITGRILFAANEGGDYPKEL